jgi:transposase
MSLKGKKAKIIVGGRKKIQELIKKEKNVTVRDRLRAILWSTYKISNEEISRRLNKTKDTIAKWIRNWNKSEYEGLLNKPIPGRNRTLTAVEEEQIIDMIKRQPEENYQGRITCKMLCAEIEQRFEKRISPEGLRHYLKKNRLSWKKSGLYNYRRNDEHRQQFLWKLEETKKKSEGKRVDMVYG